MILFTSEEIKRVIEAEPELPHDMPDKMQRFVCSMAINYDVDVVRDLLREVVWETKKAILERLGI